MFAQILQNVIPVDGMITEMYSGNDVGFVILKASIAFIFMPLDRGLASRNTTDMSRTELEKEGVVGQRSRWVIVAQQLPEFSDSALSKSIFEEILALKLVNPDGKLLRDPRRTTILSATMNVVKDLVREDRISLVTENLRELYNVAWDHHEMTCERVPEAIDFLLAHTNKVCP
jgi:hypothetical protein